MFVFIELPPQRHAMAVQALEPVIQVDFFADAVILGEDSAMTPPNWKISWIVFNAQTDQQ